MRGTLVSPPPAQGLDRRGYALMRNPYDDEGVYGHVLRHPMTHAPPLGRAHTEPVNPGEVGCDRPELPAGSERAGYVT